MQKKCLIIGSGLAGCALARSLEKSHNVMVLDAGPARGIAYPPLEFPKKTLGEVKTCALGRGGTTNLWHNGLIPLRAEDIQNTTFRSVVESSKRYINAAAQMLHFKRDDFSSDQARLTRGAGEISQHFGDATDGVDCLVYPKRYAPLAPPTNAASVYGIKSISFTVREAAITKVDWEGESGTGAWYPDIVVVAAGSLSTPSIVSDILAAAGRQNHTAGSGLIDHPMGFVGKFRFPKSIANQVKRFALSDEKDYEYRSMIRLRSDDGKHLGSAFFRPCVSKSNDLSIYKYKSRLGASSGKQRLYHSFSLKLAHPDILSEIFQHLTGFQVPTRTYSVLFMGEQRRRENKVYKIKDGTTVVDWDISKDEMNAYSSMVKRLSAMLADVADSSEVNHTLTEDWLWSGAHHSGTISMGSDESDLVDTDLKVHGLDNVFVCDASVIQEHSYANTGLTIAQLALRLSHQLEHRIL